MKDTNIQIIWGDCGEELKQFPDNHFDLILTDPPYGIGESNEKNATRGGRTGFNGEKRKDWVKPTDFGHYEWDKQIPSADTFKEILRVSKNQVIFGGNYFIEHLHNSSCWIVWDKDNGSNDFADCELAWTSFKSAVRLFKWRWNGMLQERMNWKEKRLHPTQKPMELFRWIIKKYSNPGDLICDPFMGSGTTPIACNQLGRRCVGIEINDDYCQIAKKRLNQESLLQHTLDT